MEDLRDYLDRRDADAIDRAGHVAWIPGHGDTSWLKRRGGRCLVQVREEAREAHEDLLLRAELKAAER